MNYKYREGRIIDSIQVKQREIDAYKSMIDSLLVKLESARADFEFNASRGKDTRKDEGAIMYYAGLIDKYRTRIEKSNRKLDVLFTKLDNLSKKLNAK